MRRILVHMLAVVILGFSGPVARAAEDEPSFSRLMDEGLEAYRSKKYDQAVARFQAAYDIRAEPEIVYNIARSYEKALKGKDAIEAYERFLKLPGTTAELRANALTALDALKKERDALSKSEASKRKAVEAVDEAPSHVATAERAGTAQSEKTVLPKRSRALEWTLVGVGGAGVVAGFAFGSFALQKSNAFGKSTDPADKRAFRNDAKLNALIADIALGAGVVTAGVGLGMLLFLGDDAPVSVAPSAGAGKGMISIGGHF